MVGSGFRGHHPYLVVRQSIQTYGAEQTAHLMRSGQRGRVEEGESRGQRRREGEREKCGGERRRARGRRGREEKVMEGRDSEVGERGGTEEER